jgi:hypothetical protein
MPPSIIYPGCSVVEYQKVEQYPAKNVSAVKTSNKKEKSIPEAISQKIR